MIREQCYELKIQGHRSGEMRRGAKLLILYAFNTVQVETCTALTEGVQNRFRFLLISKGRSPPCCCAFTSGSVHVKSIKRASSSEVRCSYKSTLSFIDLVE